MAIPTSPTKRSRNEHEPGLGEVAEALARHADKRGRLLPGVGARLAKENSWTGRTAEVLEIFTKSDQKMSYLAGGRRPDEIVTWLSPWIESSLSIDQIDEIVDCGGWDPDPFVVLSDAHILNEFLRHPDGSPRRVRGELAGGWLCDNCALAEPADTLEAVEAIMEEEEGQRNGPPETGERAG